MRRRRFLSVAGVAATAGCQGEDGTTAGPGTSATAGGDRTTTAARPGQTADRPRRGVSLSPRSYADGDFSAFFERAREAGSLVRWAGDWVELGRTNGAPAVVAEVGRRHGLDPVVETGVFSASAGELFRPLTRESRERFVETLSGFCAEHAPPYLGVGVEVNLHHEAAPGSFETFVDLFAETHGAVKEVSPDTAVYAGFQLERLRGLRGGRFGGEDDPDTATWELLDRFPAADLTAVTSYPGLVHRDPADVPGDYYAALDDRATGPVAITEIGWSAETAVEGWESDEGEQAAFVRRLGGLTEGVDLEALLWLWLYEQPDVGAPFSGMGLRRGDGSARPAWDAWVADG